MRGIPTEHSLCSSAFRGRICPSCFRFHGGPVWDILSAFIFAEIFKAPSAICWGCLSFPAPSLLPLHSINRWEGVPLEQTESTVLNAVILKVWDCRLLVCDCCTGQAVLVHTDQACCFSRGDQVRILYSGAMTMSFPPQISAADISHSECC